MGIQPDTMKLSSLLTVAVVVAKEQEYESCSLISADDLPAGVASVDCAGKKCKAVCGEGLVAMGKKALTCKNGKWKGQLPECKTCSQPDLGSEGDYKVNFVCKTKKGVNQCKVKCTDDELYQNESIVLWSENDAGKWSTYTVDKLKATCRCPKIEGSNEKECAWYIGAGETYNLDQVYCTRTASTEAPSNSTTMHSTRAPTTAAQTEWEDVVDTIQP